MVDLELCLGMDVKNYRDLSFHSDLFRIEEEVPEFGEPIIPEGSEAQTFGDYDSSVSASLDLKEELEEIYEERNIEYNQPQTTNQKKPSIFARMWESIKGTEEANDYAVKRQAPTTDSSDIYDTPAFLRKKK